MSFNDWLNLTLVTVCASVITFNQTVVYTELKRIQNSKNIDERVYKTAQCLESCCDPLKLEESYREFIRYYAKYSHFVKLISREEYGPIKLQIQTACGLANDHDMYLIEPVQRVCRYPLLLDKMIREKCLDRLRMFIVTSCSCKLLF